MAHDSHAAHGKMAHGKSTERRFITEPTERSNFQALVGGLGAAALGAGAYATWMPDTPMTIAPFLFGGGTIAIIVASVMGSSDSSPIRVGDAGVATETAAGQPERIGWYQVEKVSLEDGDRIVVLGAGKRVVARLAHHGTAAAWILKEALDRIPKRVTVAGDRSAQILRATDEGGAVVAIEPVQVTGRRCKASNIVISFELDARTCSRCGEVYDKKHVPAKCLTCDAPMTKSS